MESLRKDIIESARRFIDKSYSAGNDRNINAQVYQDAVLITATRTGEGFLKFKDLGIIDANRKLLSEECKPSSESNVHLKTYTRRPDASIVCHVHLPHASGFTAARIPLGKIILPEIIIGLRITPIAEYGTSV